MQCKLPLRGPVRTLLSFFPAWAILSAGLVIPAFARADQPEFVQGEVLVGIARQNTTRGDVQALPDLAQMVQGVGRMVSFHPELGVVRVELNRGWSVAQAVEALRPRAGVLYAEPNYIHRTAATPNDTYYASKQWAPKKIRMDLAWDLWAPQTQKIIAILDTGVQLTHPDLVNVLYKDAAGNVIGYNVRNPSSPPEDDSGHGTHVAGTAAAEINNAKGVSGIAGWNPSIGGSTAYVRIMPVKVLTNSSGTDLEIADGILWAANNGASVINLSLGSTGTSNTLSNSVATAIASDVVVVCAAGNNGNTVKYYPAAYNNVISVAATNSTDTLASWSNYGTWVKVAAPGVSIYSTYKNSGYTNMDGTSMAAPHVAGEAVLLRSAFPALTNLQINALITSNTDPYNPYNGRTIGAGAGRINVYKALVTAGAGAYGVIGHTLSPNPVTGGTISTGTVTIASTAPAGGTLVTLSSDSASAAVPATVTILQGQSSATYTATTQSVVSSVTINITAATNDNSMVASLVVNSAEASAVSLNPSTIAGGNPSTGTVTLNGPAPAGGLAVALFSNKSAATVPTSVTVLEGQTSATFTAATTPVTASTAVTIKAQTGATIKTATLNVKPPTPVSVTFSPSSVVSGYGTTGKVTLNGPSPTGGTTVTFTSNRPEVAAPASVVVPAGDAEATFAVSTGNALTSLTITISAKANSTTKTGSFTLLPLFKSISISPTGLYGTQNSTGTITLNAAALSDVAVVLSSNNAAVSVPSGATVPTGQLTTTFPISTSPVAVKTLAAISGTMLGVTKSANISIKPPSLSSVTFSPTLVATGQNSTGKLMLNYAAPAGYTVLLTSSNSTAAPVPASVTFVAGSLTATFPVTGGPVASQTQVTITGKDPANLARSGILTVKP